MTKPLIPYDVGPALPRGVFSAWDHAIILYHVTLWPTHARSFSPDPVAHTSQIHREQATFRERFDPIHFVWGDPRLLVVFSPMIR